MPKFCEWQGTHMENFDIGGKFHNCLLRLCKRTFFGGVVPFNIVKTMKESKHLMKLTRLPFVWSPPPVFSLRMLARAIELSKRHPSESTSDFQLSRVI